MIGLLKNIQLFRLGINDFWTSVWAFIAFASILFGVKLMLIGSYGNATPFWDQWDAEAASLYKPFLEGTLRWTDLFSLHNEHRILFTRLLALELLTTNGIWNPLLQMVVNASLHITTLIVAIILIMRVIGRNYLPVMLVFSLILFSAPYAWENTLAGFQSQFYFVLLFSFSCLWLCIVHPPLSIGWWAGILCAVFAFFSLASGVFSLAAVGVISTAFYMLGLRRTNAQLIAIMILFGLFVLGVMLTPSLPNHAELKAESFFQFYDSLTAILGWPVSSNIVVSVFRNLPALVFVGIMLWTRPSVDNRKWFLAALVVWVMGQSVLLMVEQ